jgi:hypothetical protein
MSWDKDDTGLVTFTCDSGCGTVAQIDGRILMACSKGPATEFTLAWKDAEHAGWRSFKRTGGPWTYHCAGCVPAATRAHNEHLEREQERERIRARNGRQ